MGSFWVEIGMESLRSPNGPSSAFFQWKTVRGPRMGRRDSGGRVTRFDAGGGKKRKKRLSKGEKTEIRELEKLKNFKIQALLYQRFNRNLFIS